MFKVVMKEGSRVWGVIVNANTPRRYVMAKFFNGKRQATNYIKSIKKDCGNNTLHPCKMTVSEVEW